MLHLIDFKQYIYIYMRLIAWFPLFLGNLENIWALKKKFREFVFASGWMMIICPHTASPCLGLVLLYKKMQNLILIAKLGVEIWSVLEKDVPFPPSLFVGTVWLVKCLNGGLTVYRWYIFIHGFILMSQTINGNQLLKYTVMFLISQLNSTINVRQQMYQFNMGFGCCQYFELTFVKL